MIKALTTKIVKAVGERSVGLAPDPSAQFPLDLPLIICLNLYLKFCLDKVFVDFSHFQSQLLK